MCKKLWLAVGAMPCACPVCKNGQPQEIAPTSPCSCWRGFCVGTDMLSVPTRMLTLLSLQKSYLLAQSLCIANLFYYRSS